MRSINVTAEHPVKVKTVVGQYSCVGERGCVSALLHFDSSQMDALRYSKWLRTTQTSLCLLFSSSRKKSQMTMAVSHVSILSLTVDFNIIYIQWLFSPVFSCMLLSLWKKHSAYREVWPDSTPTVYVLCVDWWILCNLVKDSGEDHWSLVVSIMYLMFIWSSLFSVLCHKDNCWITFALFPKK